MFIRVPKHTILQGSEGILDTYVEIVLRPNANSDASPADCLTDTKEKLGSC